MAEYLEHEKVLDDKNIITVQTREYGSIEVIPVDTITDIELADAKPVKRGRWEKDKCSECKKSLEDIFSGDFYYDYDEVHYCPNCGADMRGAENG